MYFHNGYALNSSKQINWKSHGSETHLPKIFWSRRLQRIDSSFNCDDKSQPWVEGQSSYNFTIHTQPFPWTLSISKSNGPEWAIYQIDYCQDRQLKMAWPRPDSCQIWWTWAMIGTSIASCDPQWRPTVTQLTGLRTQRLWVRATESSIHSIKFLGGSKSSSGQVKVRSKSCSGQI